MSKQADQLVPVAVSLTMMPIEPEQGTRCDCGAALLVNADISSSIRMTCPESDSCRSADSVTLNRGRDVQTVIDRIKQLRILPRLRSQF